MNADNDAVVTAIKSLSDSLANRIEGVENDFLEHLRKVEGQLSVLVDLTKTVAVLQTQTGHFFEELNEVRVAVRENATRADQSLQRTHGRIDDTNLSTRTRIEVTEKDFQLALKTVSNETNKKLDDLVANHHTLSRKIDNWFSWGRGAYAVAGLLAAFIIWTGNRWLTDLESKVAEITSLKTQIVELHNRLNRYTIQEPRNGNGESTYPPARR